MPEKKIKVLFFKTLAGNEPVKEYRGRYQIDRVFLADWHSVGQKDGYRFMGSSNTFTGQNFPRIFYGLEWLHGTTAWYYQEKPKNTERRVGIGKKTPEHFFERRYCK